MLPFPEERRPISFNMDLKNKHRLILKKIETFILTFKIQTQRKNIYIKKKIKLPSTISLTFEATKLNYCFI